MEKCALWLKFSGFICCLLLMGSVSALYDYNLNMGRVNISEYVQQNPDDPLATGRNLMCAKVTYPSLFVFLSRVDEAFFNGGVIDWGELGEDSTQFYSFITVNHHGKADTLQLSGVLNAFATVDTHLDRDARLCVHHEPFQADVYTEPDSYNSLTVDWLSVMNYLSYLDWNNLNREIIASVVAGDVQCAIVAKHSYFPVSTILLNIAPLDPAAYANEHALWVDGMGKQDSFFGLKDYSAKVCVAITNAANESFSGDLELSVIFLFEDELLNYGNVPLGHYHVEFGNVSLAVPKDNTNTHWNLACIDLPFIAAFTSAPYVFVTVSFRERSIHDSEEESAISAWVEFINEVGFRGCVARPRFAAVTPTNAATPYLEYAIFSQDGIYDEMLESQKHLRLAITLKIEIPTDVSTFISDYKATGIGIISLLASISNIYVYDFWNYGYFTNPSSSTVYFFARYDSNEGDPHALMDILDAHFAEGVVPYETDLNGTAQKVMDALYPNGEPSSDEEMVKIEVMYDWGCVVGPYEVEEECSAECTEDGVGGVKTLSREITSNRTSTLCPIQRKEVACNLPPCTMEGPCVLTDFSVPKKATDLTWLWVLIGVVGGILVIVGGFFIYRYFSKSIVVENTSLTRSSIQRRSF